MNESTIGAVGKEEGDALRLGQKLEVEDGEGSEICRWSRGLDLEGKGNP